MRIVLLLALLTACHSSTAPPQPPRCHWITVATARGPLQVPFCPAP